MVAVWVAMIRNLEVFWQKFACRLRQASRLALLLVDKYVSKLGCDRAKLSCSFACMHQSFMGPRSHRFL